MVVIQIKKKKKEEKERKKEREEKRLAVLHHTQPHNTHTHIHTCIHTLKGFGSIIVRAAESNLIPRIYNDDNENKSHRAFRGRL